MARTAKGVRKHGAGFQAYVRLGGILHVKQYPASVKLSTMLDWRHEMKRQYRWTHRAGTPEVSATTFAEDADTYLSAVRQMPSYADRERDILLWVGVFSDRFRRDITPADIAAQLQSWRATCAASTVNHRRTALMHLYTRLDGKHQVNPVRAVPKFPEPDAEPRGLPYADLEKILAAMPDCQTRARLTVMLWTGWPQKQLARLEPADVDLKLGTAYVRSRRKGHGVKGRVLPLLPQAVKALKAFHRWDCWGPFSVSSMHKSFRLACDKLIKEDAKRWGHLARVRPYDLRHSFGTMLALTTKDDRAVQTLMLHSQPQQTQRYTMGAVDARVAAALATIGNFSLRKPRIDRAKRPLAGRRPRKTPQKSRMTR